MEGARFGIFDFSPSTGELRRNGVTIRLQAQPAKVLAALVSRPGEVITRETLQREIWGDGTHVDFERGLNFCIAQVRSALGDSAEAPRYIETIPKQGYRFIAPIHVVEKEVAGPTLDSDPSEAAKSEPPPATPASRWPRAATLAATVAIMLIAASIAAAIVWARVSSSPPTLVVIPFYNETGRPELDPLARAIGDATVASIAAPERTATVSVIGNASSLRNPFARQDVQQIARDLDAPWVLIGQLKADGAGLRVIAHLIRASDMKHLWARTFDDRAFALDAQARTAEAIAVAVAGSLASSR